MTAYGLVASLAWTASAVLFVERLFRFAQRWLDVQHQQGEPAKPVALPEDIEGFILANDGPTPDSTETMRDQLRAAARERFAKLGDWNAVRRAFGVAAVDGQVTA